MIRFWCTVARNWREDRENFDRENTDPQKVLRAHYFSTYRRTTVLRVPIGRAAASFGILFIGRKVRSPETVLHEYGHRLQLQERGFWGYLFCIAVPSVCANLLWRMGLLRHGYYESKWEAEADRLGGVSPRRGGE